MWKRIILWVITLIWVCGIFYFSAQPAAKSADVSSKVAKKIARSISRDEVSESEIEAVARKIHRAVRKTAHFVSYLVLGVLSFLLCKSYGLSGVRRCLIALGSSALYAASDELHQFFVLGRSCQITDVLLDSFGAFVGILLALTCGRIWKVIIKKR